MRPNSDIAARQGERGDAAGRAVTARRRTERGPMDFWGHVYDLRRKSLIPREWSRDHLRPHLEKPRGPFLPNTITTEPSNRSVKIDGSDPGYSVKNGQSPKAWRVQEGVFRLVVDPDDDREVRRTPSHGLPIPARRSRLQAVPQAGAMSDFSLVDALVAFAQQPYDPLPGGRRTPIAKAGELRPILDAGERWYTWPVDDGKLFEHTGIRLRSYSRLDKNIELKHALHERFVQAGCDERTRIVKYYVEVFGGIHGLAPGILRDYACDRAEGLASHSLERIASRSKALVLHDPLRYAIYDSRVSVSLNYLIIRRIGHGRGYLGQHDGRKCFPLPPSQNKLVQHAQSTCRTLAERFGLDFYDDSPSTGSEHFYLDYLNSLRDCARRLGELRQRKICIHFVESMLFGLAERCAAGLSAADRLSAPLDMTVQACPECGGSRFDLGRSGDTLRCRNCGERLTAARLVAASAPLTDDGSSVDS